MIIKDEIVREEINTKEDIELEQDTIFKKDIKCKDIISVNGRWNMNASNVSAENINVRNITAKDINAKNINADDINAHDINAWNMNIKNIDAGDIHADNINAWDINAGYIDAGNIDSGDINAWEINAWNINAWDILIEKRIKKEKSSKTIARNYIINKSNVKREERVEKNINITFVKATLEDSKDLLEWRNDKQTRENSFNSSLITLEEHNKWFESSLNNKLRDIFILYDKDNKIGTVRFDRFDRKKYAEISITIKPDARGKGYGSTAIKLLSEFYLEEYDLNYISALIKPFNETSSKSFVKAGYIYDKKYEDRLEYVYVKDLREK